MIKKIQPFILFTLIVASLQIPNCEMTQQICKNCVDGYVLVEIDPYQEECMNKMELEQLQSKIPHCIQGYNDVCNSCERGYLIDNERKQSLNKEHCSRLDSQNNCT